MAFVAKNRECMLESEGEAGQERVSGKVYLYGVCTCTWMPQLRRRQDGTNRRQRPNKLELQTLTTGNSQLARGGRRYLVFLPVFHQQGARNGGVLLGWPASNNVTAPVQQVLSSMLIRLGKYIWCEVWMDPAAASLVAGLGFGV
jgi:hypothetical protein